MFHNSEDFKEASLKCQIADTNSVLLSQSLNEAGKPSVKLDKEVDLKLLDEKTGKLLPSLEIINDSKCGPHHFNDGHIAPTKPDAWVKPGFEKPGYEKPGEYVKPGFEKPGYEKPGYEKPGAGNGKPELTKEEMAMIIQKKMAAAGIYETPSVIKPSGQKPEPLHKAPLK